MESPPLRIPEHELPAASARDRFFAALDPAPVGMVSCDLEGRVRRANAAFGRILGLAPGELVGTRFQDFTHPDDLPMNQQEVDRLLAGEIPAARIQKRYVRPDGGIVWADVAVVLVRDEAGTPSELLAVIQDVSPEHATRASLERRETELHTVLAEYPDIIARFDSDLRHLYVNAAITRETGLQPEEVVGRTNRELGFPEEMCATWERLLRRGFARREPFDVEWEWTDSERGTIRYHSRLLPELDDEGRVRTLLGITRDVTETRPLERALAAEGRYQALVEATSAAVWRAGPDGLFHGAQPSWEALTGQTRGEVQGLGWLAAVHPDDRRHTLAAWTAAVAEGRAYEEERRVRTASGEWRPMHCRAAPVPGPDGAPIEWIGAETDISARRRAEKTVRFQASLLEAVDHAVVATDLSGRVTYWNRPAERLLGWSSEETAGRDLNALLADAGWPGDPTGLLRRLQAGHGWSEEMELTRRDRTRFHALLGVAAVRNEAGGLTGVVRVLTDVTELKKVEAAARDSEIRFRALALTSPDFIAVRDVATGAVTFANRDALLGWPVLSEGAETQLDAAVHPDDREASRRTWDDAVHGRGLAALEYRMRRPDGAWEWVEARYAVFTAHADGRPREMLCTLRVAGVVGVTVG